MPILLPPASSAAWADRDAVLSLVAAQGACLKFASADLRNDFDVVLAAVTRCGNALQHASPTLRGDLVVVVKAMERTPSALQYASDSLRSDPAFVLSYVRTNVRLLRCVHCSLRGNRGFILSAIEEFGGDVLRYASLELRKTRDVVGAAVAKCGDALEHAHATLRNDHGIVLAAVESLDSDNAVQGASPLRFASPVVCDDFAIVCAAVKRAPIAILNASARFLRDRDLLIEVLSSSRRAAYAFKHVTEELRSDRRVVMAAVASNGWLLRFAPDALRNDREVVLAAMASNGKALVHAAREFRADREVVLAAVANRGSALGFASSALRDDRDVVVAAVASRGDLSRVSGERFPLCELSRVLVHASARLMHDRAFAMDAVKANGWALWRFALQLEDDREFVLAAVTQNGQVLSGFRRGARFREDAEVVRAAVHNDRRALRYVESHNRAAYRRAGPTETRLLFKHMPFPFDLPTDVVAHHILPRCHLV